jgi:hypothetical protein
MGYVSYAYITTEVGEELPVPEDAHEILKMFWKLLPYYDKLTFGQIIMSAFVLVASIEFLRLKVWARTALELVSWWVVLLHLGFGFIWVYMWMIQSFAIADGPGSIMLTLVYIGISLVGVVIMFIFTIPFFYVIRYLRREKIREVFT